MFPFLGNIAILSGSSRHSLSQFLLLQFTVFSIQNSVVQNYLQVINFADGKDSLYLVQKVALRAWLWGQKGNSSVAKLLLSVKSFMIITLIAQALMRMIERCANHQLGGSKQSNKK